MKTRVTQSGPLTTYLYIIESNGLYRIATSNMAYSAYGINWALGTRVDGYIMYEFRDDGAIQARSDLSKMVSADRVETGLFNLSNSDLDSLDDFLTDRGGVMKTYEDVQADSQERERNVNKRFDGLQGARATRKVENGRIIKI